MVDLSLYPKHAFKSLIYSCGSCDSCKKFITCSNIFIFTVKKKTNMSLRENLIAILATLITKNFVNLCSEQYVESATNFKNKCEKRHPRKEKSEMSETC